jgi:hypothetical protein
VVYEHPAFIKHVPVSDRPDYVRNMVYAVGRRYIATDYSAFESLFTKCIMEACEFELYEYMLSRHPEGKRILERMIRVLGGSNKLRYKYFTVMLEATRMSGEMCTSLGNGFSNLMFMEFVCSKVGSSRIEGVVEGDDGLFGVEGTLPTAEDFKKLGLAIKLEVHDTLDTAGFCGIIFDTENSINLVTQSKH